MPQYVFSVTGIFAYEDRLYNSVLKRENTSQGKLMFWHTLRSICGKDYSQGCNKCYKVSCNSKVVSVTTLM